MKQSEERIYNVIWADDDIYQLATDKDISDWRENDHINIIARAQTGEQLRAAMKDDIDMVDAVIVDANFDAEEFTVDDEKVISGLRRAFELNRLYNEDQQKGIPFFLYTGRTKAILDEACDASERKSMKALFEDTGRWFVKGSSGVLDRLFDKIKADADMVNTIEFTLRRQFTKEFNAAELIDKGQDWLMKALKFEYEITGEHRSTEEYFNPARMIWEKIQSLCKQKDIFPPISKINSEADFLLGNKVEGYTQTEQIMPMPLAHSLKYFLNITQDGSHTKDDLTLKVVNYVRERKNVNLYRTILYIAMDLLLWYKDTIESDKRHLWKAEYILVEQVKSTIVEGEQGKKLKRFYVGRYSLLPRRDAQNQLIQMKEGDLVGVKTDRNCKENNPQFIGEDGIAVDKTLMDYIILNKTE